MIDISAVVACCDDEERIGHVVRSVGDHLASLGLRFELLVMDEGSTDNTVALLSLMRRKIPELEIFAGAAPGQGLVRGAQLARGRALLLLDARNEPPLQALGFALTRIDGGYDVISLAGRGLVVRRTRSWRAFDALVHRRAPADLERRFLRRARSLGLTIHVPEAPRPTSTWERLRNLLLAPIAS